MGWCDCTWPRRREIIQRSARVYPTSQRTMLLCKHNYAPLGYYKGIWSGPFYDLNHSNGPQNQCFLQLSLQSPVWMLGVSMSRGKPGRCSIPLESRGNPDRLVARLFRTYSANRDCRGNEHGFEFWTFQDWIQGVRSCSFALLSKELLTLRINLSNKNTFKSPQKQGKISKSADFKRVFRKHFGRPVGLNEQVCPVNRSWIDKRIGRTMYSPVKNVSVVPNSRITLMKIPVLLFKRYIPNGFSRNLRSSRYFRWISKLEKYIHRHKISTCPQGINLVWWKQIQPNKHARSRSRTGNVSDGSARWWVSDGDTHATYCFSVEIQIHDNLRILEEIYMVCVGLRIRTPVITRSYKLPSMPQATPSKPKINNSEFFQGSSRNFAPISRFSTGTKLELCEELPTSLEQMCSISRVMQSPIWTINLWMLGCLVERK